MTESEWLESDDPAAMLEWYTGEAGDGSRDIGNDISPRKLRLFAVALFRDAMAGRLSDADRSAISEAEQVADGAVGLNARLTDWLILAPDDRLAARLRDCFDAAAPFSPPAVMLRDIVGNPFRPAPSVALGPPLSGLALRGLIQAAYELRRDDGTLDGDRLAVLSDALEEAGCHDAAILAALRSPGPHYRGFWALDLLLGRE